MKKFWHQFWLIHPDGYKFIVLFALLTGVGFLYFTPAGLAGVVVTIWSMRFFRDPVRSVPKGTGLVVSPADGEIVLLGSATPPAELEMPAGNYLRIAIFMNIFNCHVNRLPVEGRIRKLAYRKGKFMNAELDKASEDNERQAYWVESKDKQDIAVVQIAGLVARRIVCFVKEGQALKRGERIGLIRFGSRVDVYLPQPVAVQVAIGQTAIAGETILARLGNGEAVNGSQKT